MDILNIKRSNYIHLLTTLLKALEPLHHPSRAPRPRLSHLQAKRKDPPPSHPRFLLFSVFPGAHAQLQSLPCPTNHVPQVPSPINGISAEERAWIRATVVPSERAGHIYASVWPWLPNPRQKSYTGR
jgi:hypothetical protein